MYLINNFTPAKILFMVLFCVFAYGYDLGEKVSQCAGPFYRNSPVFPDPADCTKYFECDFGGYLVQKDCGDGTRFDAENSVCVHKTTDTC